jgi:hypothetical protein
MHCPRLRGPGTCALVLAAAMAALMTGTAQAASSVPTARPAVAAHAGSGLPSRSAAVFAGEADLNSVSCPGASWCMAVGRYTTTDGVSHSLAMIFNGAAWRVVKNPAGKGLSAVSCSATTFCMTAGGPTGAERWNGSSWRTMPSPRGGLLSLTCASRSFCVRIHPGHRATKWPMVFFSELTSRQFSPVAPCSDA